MFVSNKPYPNGEISMDTIGHIEQAMKVQLDSSSAVAKLSLWSVVNALWFAHSAHHNSEEYNLTTALRQGAFQIPAKYFFYMPFALFFPLKLFVWHSDFNVLYQFWIHTRLVPKLGPLEWIVLRLSSFTWLSSHG